MTIEIYRWEHRRDDEALIIQDLERFGPEHNTLSIYTGGHDRGQSISLPRSQVPALVEALLKYMTSKDDGPDVRLGYGYEQQLPGLYLYDAKTSLILASDDTNEFEDGGFDYRAVADARIFKSVETKKP